MAIELTPNISGYQNMEKDIKAFQKFENGKLGPLLRIYSWQPSCISLGYSQKAEKLLDLTAANQFGFDIVKRPTGGGLVFHNKDEVTYTLILPYDYPGLPKGLIPTYKYISQIVVKALKFFGIAAKIAAMPKKPGRANANLCFSYPAEYEIVVDDKKMVGSAQKRGKRGFLQHGSIFVSRHNFDKFSQVLLNKDDENLAKAISIEEIINHKLIFKKISATLKQCFQAALKIN